MPKPVRFVLAVVVALLVWATVATLVNFGLRATIAGYRAEEVAVSFSLTSQIARLALGVIATAASAVAAVVISRGKHSAAIASGLLLLLLFIPIHVKLWPRFPIWYHLFFLMSLPLVSFVVGRVWAKRDGAA